MELESKACWAIKKLNFDLKASSVERLLQLNKLEELRSDAYESTRLYKKKTKWWHDNSYLEASSIWDNKCCCTTPGYDSFRVN